jgi:hypothetical protein
MNLLKLLHLLILANFCLIILDAEDKLESLEKKDVAPIENIIPSVILADLTLKPTKTPYKTNGFTVPRGITLTIEPGVTIMQDEIKADSEPVIVEGKLIIGKKGGSLVNIEIPKSAEFSGATVEMYHVNFTSSNITLSGGTEGTFANCQFNHILTKKINSPFTLNIPQRGILSFTSCNFVNHSISLPDNIFETKDKIKLTNCAFNPQWDPKMDRYTSVKIDSRIFLVGDKCDLNTFIEWKSLAGEFETPFATDWYIKDKSMHKSLLSALSSTKGYSIKLGSPNTNFKPTPAIPKKK